MFRYEDFFSEELANLKTDGRYRYFTNLKRIVGSFPFAEWHDGARKRLVTVWCSNDYLGMGQHPTILGAMQETLEEMGAGAGGTRNISGTHCSIVELERELADLTGHEAALVFTSGYVANQTALATLASRIPGVQVFSDALNHDSIIQGLRLGRAQKQIFCHNDVEHLEELLAATDPECPKLIVFESVYSMEGHFGKVKEIIELAEKYGALTYIDETHAVGLYGERGGGVAQKLHLAHRISILQGGLGKAFGLVGGFITGSRQLIDFVRSFGNGFIFTTTLPPCITAGAVASIRYLKKSSVERRLVQASASLLRDMLVDVGIPFIPGDSHIVPVLIGNAKICRKVSETLLEEYGHYIQPINFPTVPKGTERLRITPGPLHTKEMITNLVDALDRVWDQFGLPRTFNGEDLVEAICAA